MFQQHNTGKMQHIRKFKTDSSQAQYSYYFNPFATHELMTLHLMAWYEGEKSIRAQGVCTIYKNFN